MIGWQRINLAVLLTIMTLPLCANDTQRPRLLLSASDVATINATDPLPPSFALAVSQASARVDRYLDQIPDVPYPKDGGGGYTHEQHKFNSATILEAGVLYQLTGDKAYADLARDLLLAYAEMYPGLGEHPKKKEQSWGRLFWQSLNEAVFLVTTIQGYDAIYLALSDSERENIENNLFRPLASFISVESPQTFDRIHNHGTWAVAAVGMTGYVLGDQDYVEMALYGLKKDGSAGFMKQLDELFSPDGYYSEGPYYQRYALMPFSIFAAVIERNDPDREIFKYRDGVVLKAINSVIQMSYGGYFFPINDAIKDKGLDTLELCYGVSIAYDQDGDPGLLSIAEFQQRIVLTGDGFRTAQALDAGKAEPFVFRSMQLFDGPDGDRGSLDIFRTGNPPDQQALVFKATAQGMGHGHFDRLNWLFYDNGREIITDYGAARFLNVEEKYGGHYLPENNSWAKQTVAHNTLVVDEQSQFGGDWELGELGHPVPLVFDLSEKIDISSARMAGAYEGVEFTRVMALLKDESLTQPLILDVLKADSDDRHQYDLPLYYQGHITNISHPIESNTNSLAPLGEDNGYQHLWVKATSRVNANERFTVTWLTGNRFYTFSILADAPLEVFFTETGATDPDFNLRTETGLLFRVKDAKETTFVSVLEPHGEYNGSREFTTASTSGISDMRHLSEGALDVITLDTGNAKTKSIALSYDPDAGKEYTVQSSGVVYQWSGFYRLFEQ